MTTNQEQSPAGEEQNNSGIGPGSMLREAREARGWSQQDVARRLNLRLAVIESIDDDHYKAGVALTFLRGYVKAYAKLVAVNEQQALSAFDSMSGTEQLRSAGPAPMQSFSKKTRQQASDKWLKLTSWLVVLGLLISLVFWWWQHSSTGYIEAPASEQITEAPPVVQTEAADVVHSEPEPKPVPEPEFKPEPQQAAAASVEVTTEPAEAVSPAAESETVVAETPADPELLVLNFTADCWIKISDAEGRILSEGVKTASDSLTLKGKPPFRLVLGAPQAVSVEYLNQAVELSSFRAGRVARLTVPQS